MNQTNLFFVFTILATVLCFLFVISSRSVASSEKKARWFYFFCVALSLTALAANLLSVSGLLPMKGTLGTIYQALIFRLWIVTGMGIVSMVLSLLREFRSFASNHTIRSFVASPYVLRGICFSVSISFLAVEIGKLTHDADMRQFFLDSGLPVWFLYFVIVAETLGAIGLFLRKLILPAAFGLAILMVGAIFTHYNNGDPFSDSIEAFHLLILLICIIVIRLIHQRGANMNYS
jgi:uncharacterized membrane protein YphA (DoxX/SURF4 family)